MSREVKSIPYFAIKAEGGGRSRKGIAAVFGNVDSTGDRIVPGAFAKTVNEGRSRIKHLWNHGFHNPPIASIKDIKEVGREDLPQAVLDYAPEATGGLLVEREYYKTELADWVLQAIDAGDITEMSFGFDVIASTDVTENEKTIRELKELKLYDTSDVLWGANAATAAIGAKNLYTPMPLGALVVDLAAIASAVKAGTVEADAELIDAVYRAAVDMGYHDSPAEELESVQELNQTDEGTAEAAVKGTSLELLKLRTEGLALRARAIHQL